MLYRVARGTDWAAEVVALKDAATARNRGVESAIADLGVGIDDATVVQTDITTANGVIHVVEMVIPPRGCEKRGVSII